MLFRRLFLVIIVLTALGISGIVYLITRNTDAPRGFPRDKTRFSPVHTVITSANASQLELLSTVDITHWSGDIQFDGNSEKLIIGLGNGAVVIDVKRGREQLYLELFSLCDGYDPKYGCSTLLIGYNYRAAISPDGQLITTSIARYQYNNMSVWNADTGALIKDFGKNNGLWLMLFSPDGELLVYTGSEGECVGLCAWNVNTGEVFQIQLATPSQAIFVGDNLVFYQSGSIYIWNKDTHDISLVTNAAGTKLLAVSAELEIIATLVNNEIIKIWNNDFEKTITLNGHDDYVNNIALSPDGNLLASASHDNTVKLWDTSTGELVATLQSGSGYGLVFSPDGSVLATGYNPVYLWDVQTDELLQTLPVESYVGTLLFSPDGTLLVSSEGYIWGIPD